MTGARSFVTCAMSERSFRPHGSVYRAMGRRVGEIVLIVMQKTATEAVKPMMVLSHIGSREMRGSSITRREVIWPMAAKISEDAFTGVNSTATGSQQLPPSLSQLVATLMRVGAYLLCRRHEGHSSMLDLPPLSSMVTNSLLSFLSVCSFIFQHIAPVQ